MDQYQHLRDLSRTSYAGRHAIHRPCESRIENGLRGWVCRGRTTFVELHHLTSTRRHARAVGYGVAPARPRNQTDIQPADGYGERRIKLYLHRDGRSPGGEALLE